MQPTNDDDQLLWERERKDLGEHVSLGRLEEARELPNTAMIMDADSGGQMLFACPVQGVRAPKRVLRQLLADLEDITWGQGFAESDSSAPLDASIYFIHTKNPDAPTEYPNSPWRLGAKGYWFDNEISALGLEEQIQAIVAGAQERLTLSARFPHEELDDPREIHPYFVRASVQIHSNTRDQFILMWPACAVKITREPLQQLGDLLESSIKAMADLRAKRAVSKSRFSSRPEMPPDFTPGPTTVSITRQGAPNASPKFNAALLPHIHVQRVVLALQGELPIDRVIDPRPLTRDDLIKPE